MNHLAFESLAAYWSTAEVSVNLVVFMNILGALILGLIVGYERSYHGRAAGMRTYRWQAMVIRTTAAGVGLMFDRLRPPAITRLLAALDTGLSPVTGAGNVTTLDGSSGSTDHGFSPDGMKLYVTNLDGKIHVYDTATGAEATPIAVGSNPLYGISVSPDGRQALVSDDGATIHVIDLNSGTETGDINTGLVQPGSMQYTPNGAGACPRPRRSRGPSTRPGGRSGR